MKPMAKSGDKGGRATPKTNQEFIDYRFNELHEKVESVNRELKEDIKGVRDEVHSSFETINEKLDKAFATKDHVASELNKRDNQLSLLQADVALLKKIVYGAVGLILTAFILAVIGLVIVSKQS